MAWLVWKNVLQQGSYTTLMRRMLPAWCHRRGYLLVINDYIRENSYSDRESLFDVIFNNAFPNLSREILSSYRDAGLELFSSCLRETTELNGIFCMWYYLLKEIDPCFWTTCIQLRQRRHNNHTDTEPLLVPLYKIYQRLIFVFGENFGIPLGNVDPDLLNKIEEGPEREAKRQKRREERNLRRRR